MRLAGDVAQLDDRGDEEGLTYPSIDFGYEHAGEIGSPPGDSTDRPLA
jgi:hypothetical protein